MTAFSAKPKKSSATATKVLLFNHRIRELETKVRKIAPDATVPSKKCFVTLTGSVTVPHRMKILVAKAPIPSVRTKDFSTAKFNMGPILLSTQLLITHKLA
jgi:hypothetical protein